MLAVAEHLPRNEPHSSYGLIDEGRPQGTCKVLVSRIHVGVDKKEIHSLLSTFGNVSSCEVCQDQDKDRSYFYRLLVTFEATEQAQQAVRNLSGFRVGGSVLRLDYFNSNFGDMNGGGPPPHHNKRHNGHMGGRANAAMSNGAHAGGHGGHHGGRGGSMMNGGHINGSMRPPIGGYYSGHVGHLPPKELPVRMLVPSDMVGAIIGKSGATITSITQQSQARVEVNKKNAGGIYADGQIDKVINIYGGNEPCSQACKRILEVMLQESQQAVANANDAAGGTTATETTTETTTTTIESETATTETTTETELETATATATPTTTETETATTTEAEAEAGAGAEGAEAPQPPAAAAAETPAAAAETPAAGAEAPAAPAGAAAAAAETPAAGAEAPAAPASSSSSSSVSSSSRRRDDPITLRLLAHNNLVGRVIGRNGIVIKKIMEETNAKINVSQMSDPRERVIVIKGNVEEMSKAQQQITSKMRQCYEQDLQQAMMGGYGAPDMGPPPQQIPPALSYPFHRPPLPPPLPHSYHGGPGGHHGGPHHPSTFGPPGPYGPLGMPSPAGHFYSMGDGSVEVVHVWVPSCTVGAIIGTGGSSIREMIRASGCSIKVSPTNAKDESKPKSDDSVLSKESGSENSVGGSPSSSSGVHGSSTSTKRNSGTVSSLPNPSDRRVTLTGSGEAQWRAQCLLYRKVFMEAVQNVDLNHDGGDSQIHHGQLRVEINVPSNQVGRIIGKGGSTVKDMQRSSRAIIKLPEETSKRAGTPDESVETPLYIIGDFYAVQAAQRRIRALIARNSHGPSTANGSSSSHTKKSACDETATQKVDGDCNQSESQC